METEATVYESIGRLTVGRLLGRFSSRPVVFAFPLKVLLKLFLMVTMVMGPWGSPSPIFTVEGLRLNLPIVVASIL